MIHRCTLFDKEFNFSNVSTVLGLLLGNSLFDRKLNSLAQRPQSGNLL